MNAPPGWYQDAPETAHLRWWDGDAWTDHTRQTAFAPSATTSPDGRRPRTAAHNASFGFAVVLGIVLVRALLAAATGDTALLWTLLVVLPLSFALRWVLVMRWRRAAATTRAAAGSLWYGAAVAEPPNLAFGQSGKAFFATFLPSFWRARRSGTLALHPGCLVFEPKKPRQRADGVTIQPAQLYGVSSARMGFFGVVEVTFVDGTRRRFSLRESPPPDLDARLAGVGFPIG